MPTLRTLLTDQAWQHLADIEFCKLKLDSRQVNLGDAFVLLKSTTEISPQKAFSYARAASGKAALIISEVDLAQAHIGTPWLFVPKIRAVLGSLKRAELQAKLPTRLPNTLAITGTNGKTTVATLSAQLLTACDQKVALLGTVGNGIYPNLSPASHTTADVLSLHTQTHEFATQGAQWLCLEASSHGLEQMRLQGMPIQVAVYTNLSRDHLDYHASMAAYAAAKSKLFAMDSVKYAIINYDDHAANTMAAVAQQNPAVEHLWWYSLQNTQADFFVSDYVLSLSGIRALLHTPFGKVRMVSSLLGEFNLANLVAVVAAGFAAGLSADAIEAALPKLTGAAGRMQRISEHNAPNNKGYDNDDKQSRCFLIDYAHTPDALDNALKSVKAHCQHGKLWVVFGCGGDRDKGKRPLMVKAALTHADELIITSDNPRSEALDSIIANMLTGLDKAVRQRIHVEPDRRVAIELAVKLACSGDAVLVAGKGHEDYQEILGVRHPFDDAQVLRAALKVQ